ncbi:MAG: heparinase II/III-family protein [Clostridia bacterium]|nr:heparinase II/III-family protein [Clostridia bacterium]
MNRILSFFRKYGFCRALYGVSSYFFRRIRMKGEARRLRALPPEAFEIPRDEDAPLFYREKAGDVERIAAGERKLLFYEKDDPLARSDTKYPWELHRCHELFALAASDSEEAKTLLCKALEGGESLRLYEGECSMEVSIRAISVAEALRRAPAEAERRLGAAFLKEALLFVLEHSEAGVAYQSNHYFFGLLGLSWVMALLPRHPLIGTYQKRNLRRLGALLRGTVESDGSFYECSTHYHQYVSRSLLEYLYFVPQGRTPLLLEKAAEMLAFSQGHAVDGRLVGVGDNDSGRVLPLPNYFSYDSASLEVSLSLAKELPLPEVTLGAERFGLYLFSRDGIDAAFRCDPIPDPHRNAAIGGHSHNDQLSLQLWVGGVPFFVDRGTYLYVKEDGARRDNLRTDRHNTLSLDAREQNELPEWFDYTPRRARGRELSRTDCGITAEHTGFLPYLHRRTLALSEGEVLVSDEWTSTDASTPPPGTLHFLLHPSVSVERVEKGLILTHRGERVLFSVEGEIAVEERFVSEEYGKKQKTLCLSVPILGKETKTIRIKRL